MDNPFTTLITSQFGQYDSFLKLDRLAFRAMESQLEEAMLLYAVHRARGNQSLAAEILDINRNTIRKRLERYNINCGEIAHQYTIRGMSARAEADSIRVKL